MKNAKGSRSARTPKTPAKGGKPEVTIDAGTTGVLPNPANAPAPKATRKKKPDPTVAEVPGWAKRAAARDMAAEMAEVPEAAPTIEPAALPATAKTGRPSKAAKPAKSKDPTPAAAPGSLRAIGEGWLGSLKAAGHTPSTLSSYSRDLAIAHEHFGDVAAGGITEKQIAKFNASDLVTKKRSGKGKAQPTVLKTRRALRLALVWAEQKKLIAKAPYTTKTA